VAFLDSDDEWVPDKLDLQRTVMTERPTVVFSFTDFARRSAGRPDDHHQLARWHGDTRGWSEILGPAVPYSSFGVPPPARGDFPVHIGDLYGEVLGGHFVPTFTLMVNREVAGDALWFAEDLITYEDLECHARLARVGPAAYLDCETAYQWSHPGPRITDANVYACATCRLAVIERVYGEDPAFLAAHRPRFERELRDLHLLAARWLMSRERPDEARTHVEAVPDAPLAYRVAARMPGWSTAGAARGVRAARDLTDTARGVLRGAGHRASRREGGVVAGRG
jgi:hypothetical protein